MMKICLTWTTVVCGLFSVLPADIKGQTCDCKTYVNNGLCISCDVGCHLTSNSLCYKCPPNCYSCLLDTYCYVCKTGYYGRRCDHDCNTCRNGSCTNKVCTDGCADGYFYDYEDDIYCRRCQNGCVTCNSYNRCTSCIAGHTGSYCQYCDGGFYRDGQQCRSCPQCSQCPNDNCKISCCQPSCESGICLVCISNSAGKTCAECEDGYFLYNGSCNACNLYCLDGKCNKLNGDCLNGCEIGWTGALCTENCKTNCISCRQRTNRCLSCEPGFYGRYCKYSCMSHCKDLNGTHQCSNSNGKCNDGCENGWQGRNCDERCGTNCVSCQQLNGTVCNSCKLGLYGQACTFNCSANCRLINGSRSRCNNNDGQCTDGCVEGWTGSTCTDQCAAKCTSCDQWNGTECKYCKPGYYGQSCNIGCSEHCGNMSDASRQCHQDDGTCLDDCVTGYKGDQCEQTGGNQDNGVVIGGAVGSAVVIVLILVAVLVFIFIKRRRKDQADPERSVTYENSPIYNVPCNPSVTGNDSATESTAHYTTLTPSLRAVPNREGIYEELEKKRRD